MKLLLPPVINPMFAEAAMILSEEPKESSLLKLEEQMEKEYGSGIGMAGLLRGNFYIIQEVKGNYGFSR